MLNALISLPLAWKYLFKDKICMALSAAPISIGLVLYISLGNLVFTKTIDYGKAYIEQYLSAGTLGDIAYYIAVTFLTVILFFIVNWTFVLVVSIIASPFNDLLSNRIEKIYLGEKLPSFNESLSMAITKFLPSVLNEMKKIAFIIVLTLMALLVSYIPILAPISLLITALVFSTEFIDFSWSRHSWSIKDCKKDLSKNMIGYIIGGVFFMVIVTLPIVNLIVPSLATIYFTLVWIKNNENSHKITE